LYYCNITIICMYTVRGRVVLMLLINDEQQLTLSFVTAGRFF